MEILKMQRKEGRGHKMEQKVKKIRLGWMACAVAGIFLFEPNINIVDVIPDFFGYLILAFGLGKLADLNESVYEARAGFEKMIGISAGKFLVLFWTFGLTVPSERSSSLMLWSFVFCVLELIFVLPAVIKLFKGIMELGTYYDNTSVLGYSTFQQKKKRGKNYTEKLRSLTVGFVILKSLLSFLPELADMSNLSYDESSGMVNLYRYIGIMRILAFVPVLIVGTIWLIRLIRYCMRVKRDIAFQNQIETAYCEKILPRRGLFITRGVKASSIVLGAAAVLSFDFRLGDVSFFSDSQLSSINLIPDFLSAILFLIFLFMIRRWISKVHKATYFSAIGYLVFSVVSFVEEIRFFGKYDYFSVVRSEGAASEFTVMLILEGLKICFFMATVISIGVIESRVIEEHTGYVVTKEINENTERIKATQNELRKSFLPVLICGVIYAVSDIAYELFIRKFGFMGLINVCCALLFIGILIKTIGEINNAVRTKYMLE